MSLTEERLLNWHAALFPTGHNGMQKIIVAGWRNEEGGPMQVVSGPMGREQVHYEVPEANRLAVEMEKFISWHNVKDETLDPVLKAAVAHFWFVAIYPFDGGNRRIARAITDMHLARADGSAQRFYSMSAQIRKERKAYYDILESSQKGDLDITKWLIWFLDCLDRALTSTEESYLPYCLKPVLGTLTKKTINPLFG